jgi:hypothetical protein
MSGARGAGSLSRLLLHVGMLLAALSFTSWWVSHTILDVSRTQRVTHAVLSDADFRKFVAGEIAPKVVPLESLDQALTGVGTPTTVATGTPTTTPTSTAQTATEDELQARVAAVLAQPGVESQLETFVVDVHKGLLGTTDQPAVLSQATLTQIVSAAVPEMPQADLAKLHAVTVTPPKLTTLTATRRLLKDKFGLLVALAAFCLAGAVVLSRNRRETLNMVGRWLIGISLAHLLVLWVIPVLVVPALTSSPWASLIAAVARALSAGLLTGLIVLFVAGVGILIADRFMPNPNRAT